MQMMNHASALLLALLSVAPCAAQGGTSAIAGSGHSADPALRVPYTPLEASGWERILWASPSYVVGTHSGLDIAAKVNLEAGAAHLYLGNIADISVFELDGGETVITTRWKCNCHPGEEPKEVSTTVSEKYADSDLRKHDRIVEAAKRRHPEVPPPPPAPLPKVKGPITGPKNKAPDPRNLYDIELELQVLVEDFASFERAYVLHSFLDIRKQLGGNGGLVNLPGGGSHHIIGKYLLDIESLLFPGAMAPDPKPGGQILKGWKAREQTIVEHNESQNLPPRDPGRRSKLDRRTLSREDRAAGGRLRTPHRTTQSLRESGGRLEADRLTRTVTEHRPHDPQGRRVKHRTGHNRTERVRGQTTRVLKEAGTTRNLPR